MYKYTADLLALDQCRPLPDTQCTHKYRAGITTPLRWEGWEHALRLHPDRQFVHYIVSGLREGFRVGFNYSRSCSGRVANMPSAREHPQVVRENIATECAEGRILGPLVASWADTIYVSRFGVIPKGTTGKWRLILDLSSPSDGSVNDGIDKNLCGLTYATVDQAVDIVLKLGRGALLAKIDIMHAYRLIPVHPDDHWLLGMHFEGATFMDTVLPFGLRSAPKLFNAIADSLEWICRSRGVSHIMHYLDDFLVLGAPYAPECANNLAVLRAVFDELGVPLAEHKTAGPTATLVFLGVSVDSVSLMLRLPEDKLSELRGIIQTWLGRKVTTVRELQSLVGKLENACKVVRPGRSFLRRMIELLGGVKAKRRPIRLNASFRSDLLWWHCFLASWNGVAACRSSELERPEVTVYCDASGAVGCAAWWDEGWLQYKWTPELISAPIMPKETLPIILACAVWGGTWKHKLVRVYCNNEGAVASLNSGRSREPWAMHLIRCLFFIKAIYSLELQVLHIQGVRNVLADALSRDDTNYFRSQVPKARHFKVPEQVLRLLVLERPDWTSATWTQLFVNCFPPG